MTKSKCQNKSKTQMTNIKTIVLLFGICALTLFWNLCFVICYLSFAQDKIVAIVSDDIITQKDLNDFINFMRLQLYSEYNDKHKIENKIQSMKSDLLDRLIEDKLILQEAKKYGIGVDENRVKAKIAEVKKRYSSLRDFQDALSQQGLTVADLESKIREQFLMYNIIDFKIRKKIIVNPAEVTDFYQNNAQEFNQEEQREFESLNVNNENLAKEIYQSLKKGQGVQELAKKYSFSVNRLTTTKNGELKKEIEDIVFRLNKDGVSEPVKIEGDYYIFKLNNILPRRKLNLAEVQDKIYSYLFNQKMEKEMADWLDELKKRSYIKICKD